MNHHGVNRKDLSTGMTKCQKCGLNKSIKKNTLCFPCKDAEYKSYVGELRPLKSIVDPCFFCKKALDKEGVVTVRIRKNLHRKMHKACNSKRLQQIKERQWKIRNPVSGGTGSKK